MERLSGEEPVEPEIVKELAVRLLAMAAMLLRQHAVSKRGQGNEVLSDEGAVRRIAESLASLESGDPGVTVAMLRTDLARRRAGE